MSDAAVRPVDRRRANRRKAGISGQQKGQRDSRGIWLGSETDASFEITEERGLRINRLQLRSFQVALQRHLDKVRTHFLFLIMSVSTTSQDSKLQLTHSSVRQNHFFVRRREVALVELGLTSDSSLPLTFAGQQGRNLVCPFSSLRLSLLGTDSDGLACSLFGATVTSFKTADGTERLFVSSKSKLDGSKAVRSSHLSLATTASMDRAA